MKTTYDYSSEDGVLFNKDKSELVAYPAEKSDTSYTVSESVTAIQAQAFYGCTNLTSVSLSDNIYDYGQFCIFRLYKFDGSGIV